MLQQPPDLHPRIPEFCQDAPAFFDLIKECIHHRIKKSVTNFRKPLEVGLKLAKTLRHLVTGETYTSSHITGWLVESPSANLSPRSTEISLLNSRMNICTALKPLLVEKGGREIQNQTECPNAVGAIDGKDIAMEKPKESSNDYYNYKCFFSLVLQALIDTEYRFLWIDCGSSGSCSGPHIFKRSDLMAWGFWHLNHWGREGEMCSTSCCMATTLP